MGFGTDRESCGRFSQRPLWEAESWSEDFLIFAFENFVSNPFEFPYCNHRDLGNKLGIFVRGKIPWPIIARDTQEFYLRLFGHSSLCKHCIFDAHDVEDAWTGSFGSVQEWEKGRDFGQNIVPDDGEEVIEQFLVGYDIHGYDKEGYDQQGVHHTMESVEWQGAINPIGRATAHRNVLGMIKDRIARLS